MNSKPKIIILGAGMSGVACAHSLHDKFDVQIFEKSRGVGGRLCAKNTPKGLFHYGAQYCSAQSSSFQNFLIQNDAKFFLGSFFDMKTNSCINTQNYFVGVNGMHSLLKNYNQVLNMHFNQRAIRVDEKKKLVHFESGYMESYDIVISSLPLPQAQEIFDTEIAHDAKFDPCISMGMIFNGQTNNEHNAYKNINQDISWLGSSKFYNAEDNETWVLQFSPQTSLDMYDLSDKSLEARCDDAVKNIIKGKYTIIHCGIFKWKFALCKRSDLEKKFTSISDNAFAIGDWNISPRVESAFISGNELGKFLTETQI
ncbi:NAD(P)-binding protein [Gammaproteobacteria bacterium]|nr:NAD(P)-binding protein [Gammaproteobacteria bacterium]|tara:strand:- start:5686 stop:6621 length:936 start_codon:yes stop_codon:yes gene_type:complete